MSAERDANPEVTATGRVATAVGKNLAGNALVCP